MLQSIRLSLSRLGSRQSPVFVGAYESACLHPYHYQSPYSYHIIVDDDILLPLISVSNISTIYNSHIYITTTMVE